MTTQILHQEQPWTPTYWTPTATWSTKRQAAMDSGDDSSWEVRAFAEDTSTSGQLQWPPRSYSCSFCQREFRTAQALGGHMNVHRRERAHQNQLQNQQLRNSTASWRSPQRRESTKPFLESIPDILSWSRSASPPRVQGAVYHPYEKSVSRCKPTSTSQGRFSMCLNKVMGEHVDDTMVDLELRLGRSSCAI